MHPHSPHTTLVTPLPHQVPDLNLVMYRLDQNLAETHKLREEMQQGFANVREDIKLIKEEQKVFRQELADQRLQFTQELGSSRVEFAKEINRSRAEFKADLHAMREESTRQFSAMRDESNKKYQDMREESDRKFQDMLDRTRIDMKEMVASVVATVDDKIKISGQASDLRLLKWCARAALSSSAAAGSLAYAVSKLMP